MQVHKICNEFMKKSSVESNPKLHLIWAQENQPVWRDIKSLEQKNHIVRIPHDSAECQIEVNGQQFQIEVVESSTSPDLAAAYQLLIDTFQEDEVEVEDIFRADIEGKTDQGEPYYYQSKLYILKNSKGEVVSLIKGAHITLEDEDCSPTNKSMFIIEHAVTRVDWRGLRLAQQVYISALIDLSIEAEMQGKKLLFAMGEAVENSEKFWNKLGWKRVYAQNNDNSRYYTEVPYIQPALDFDPATGEITEGVKGVLEHLMIGGFGDHITSKTELCQAVRALYNNAAKWPRSDFESDDAYNKHVCYVEFLFKSFMDFFSSRSKIIFLDQGTRDRLRKKGVTIDEFMAADANAN